MAEITFSAEQKQALVKKLQRYFEDELDQEIGDFDAEFLLDFFAREMGAHFYNQGLFDAQAALAQRLESVTEVFYELEQPTG
ncbi:DUF2164 domain-containing protein [Gallaecimonas sp. GXIMD4217]|uniref:DUF2164 domain-containing protein n=1 Tax=Gallaecimonas sp. GXIMD4217 TaxID=3131927 RepID=UPI00311B151E